MLSIARHWLFFVNLLIALWVLSPWLAPVFMHVGWIRYSLSEIQAAWQTTTDPLVLRQFIGNPEMGWKVAWSDRMVSMFTTIFLGGVVYGLLRERLKPLSLRGFIILLLPMLVDGGTHMISDFAGIGQGFRDTNTWLQMITNNTFPTAFYVGDALGSFNWWMRLITGIPFGIALVGFAFPYINGAFADIFHRSEATLMKGLEL